MVFPRASREKPLFSGVNFGASRRNRAKGAWARTKYWRIAKTIWGGSINFSFANTIYPLHGLASDARHPSVILLMNVRTELVSGMELITLPIKIYLHKNNVSCIFCSTVSENTCANVIFRKDNEFIHTIKKRSNDQYTRSDNKVMKLIK